MPAGALPNAFTVTRLMSHIREDYSVPQEDVLRATAARTAQLYRSGLFFDRNRRRSRVANHVRCLGYSDPRSRTSSSEVGYRSTHRDPIRKEPPGTNAASDPSGRAVRVWQRLPPIARPPALSID